MEKHRIKFLLLCSWVFVILSACSSSLKVSVEKKHQIEKNEEFEKTVKIVSEEPPAELAKDDKAGIPTGTSAGVTIKPEKTPLKADQTGTAATSKTSGSVKPGASTASGTSQTSAVKAVAPSNKSASSAVAVPGNEVKTSKNAKGAVGLKEIEPHKAASAVAAVPAKRQPELEDNEGFAGRRPVIDPFRVGEVVTHNVHYFKMSAGELKLKVEPFASVNGLRSYTFATEIKSSSMFSTFYSVDDRAVTHVGFDDLVPRVYSLSVNESGQVREARTFFDHKNLKATFWEKKITKKNGEEERKLEWDTLPFSQNVFSAIFYMRNFAWRDNKEYAFVVSHEKENLVFRGKVVRREKLDTKVGTFDAIVIKPEFTLKGAFKPVGDIFIWLSDDDRRYVLRIESKIRIGTLVSEVVDIQPGRP